MFSEFNTDTISIIKPNGEVYKNIKANAQPNMIFIHNKTLPLEENDKISLVSKIRNFTMQTPSYTAVQEQV
jgi:hypothetical protein